MSVVTSDQSKLVLNAFAATFQNELQSADLVSWKMYDGEFDPTNRLTVSEQVGPRYRVTQTVDGVADLTSGVQGTTFGSEIFTVNRTFNTNMGWGDFAKVRDIQGARESEAIKNAATNMAEQIDAYIMGVCATASNNWTGTPANSVATFNDVASGVTRLAEEGVAMSDLRAALTFADRQALGAAVIGLNSPDAFATSTYKNGFRSEVAGVPTLFTQQHAALTSGTRTSCGVILPGWKTGTFSRGRTADAVQLMYSRPGGMATRPCSSTSASGSMASTRPRRMSCVICRSASTSASASVA